MANMAAACRVGHRHDAELDTGTMVELAAACRVGHRLGCNSDWVDFASARPIAQVKDLEIKNAKW